MRASEEHEDLDHNGELPLDWTIFKELKIFSHESLEWTGALVPRAVDIAHAGLHFTGGLPDSKKVVKG